MQGQEIPTLRGAFAESNESDSSVKPVAWPQPTDEEKMDAVSATQRYRSEKWAPLGRAESSFTDLLSGFGGQTNSSNDFSTASSTQTLATAHSMKVQLPNQDGKFNSMSSPWSMMSSNLSLSLSDSVTKSHFQNDASYHTRGSARYGNYNGYTMHPSGQIDDHQQGNWLMPPPLPSYSHMPAHSREQIPKNMSAQQQGVKSGEGHCKLFGIPLISNPVTREPEVLHGNTNIEASQLGIQLHQSPTFESDQRSEKSKVVDKPIEDCEQEKPIQSQPLPKDGQGKVQGSLTRSCTKVLISCPHSHMLYYIHIFETYRENCFQVHKQGIALGRSVDLTKFSDYDELVAELDQLFEFNGELKARGKDWLVVYTDDEGDMMLVGDDPWQ